MYIAKLGAHWASMTPNNNKPENIFLRRFYRQLVFSGICSETEVSEQL
jgi:hypothetical protein